MSDRAKKSVPAKFRGASARAGSNPAARASRPATEPPLPLGPAAAGAGVVASALVVASLVFLWPHERLSLAYDWFQNWGYHKEYLRSVVLGQGTIPLWCRWSFSGKPFLADAETQLLYPGTWLHVLLPSGLALPFDVLFHFVLAGAGMFLFCRARGAGRGAALLSGTLWPACGFNLAHTTVGHIHYYPAVAWLPFVFLSLERWIQSRSARWIAAGAAAIALQFFAGALAVSWMTLAFGALYAAGRIAPQLVDPSARRGALIEAGGCGALFLLGLGLAGAQLLPTRELASLSVRAGRGFAYAATDALPPRELLHLLVPPTLGSTLAWEFYGYFGLVTLALSALALWAAGWRRSALPAALAGIALVLMVGDATPLFRVLYFVMPGVATFRTHAREVCILSFVAIVLAADGLDRLLSARPDERLRGVAGIAGWCVIAVAALGWLIAPHGTAAAATGIWALAAAGGGFLLSRARRGGGALRWLPAMLAVCSVVELLAAERSVRDRITIRTGTPPGQAALEKVLREEPGDFRFWFPRSQFLSDHGYALRKSAVEGYENMLLLRYQTYVHAMTGAAVKPDVINILTQANFTAAPTPFPFRALNVKYAVIPQRDGSYPLSVNPDPPGPAFLPGRAEVLAEDAILERMRDPGWDPRRVALLERTPGSWQGSDPDVPAGAGDPAAASGASGAAGRVSLVHDSPNRITAHVVAERPGILVLSEIDYPGWSVRVDGRAAELLRADYLLRAVALPGGTHEVVFTFFPASLRSGLWLTAAAAAVCLALAAFAFVSDGRAGRAG